MTFEIGDKFKLHKEVVNRLNKDEQRNFTEDSIFTISIIMHDMYCSVELGPVHWFTTPYMFPHTQETLSDIDKCTCNNFDLFNRGCKCGWIEKERAMQ